MLENLLNHEIMVAIKTLAAAMGAESTLGAVSNKICRHQSIVIASGSKICKAIAVIFNGAAGLFDQVQDIGGKVRLAEEPKEAKKEEVK